MVENKNIILIENQYRQFKLLSQTLRKNGYPVFPNISMGGEMAIANYRELIDDVRIKLSNRYNDTRREDAGKRIAKYVGSKEPAIFIIDHVLLGYTGVQTGIDLADFLRGLNKLPILFLSRTPENNIDVYRGLGRVIAPRKWLHKGFNGERILKSEYIVDTVISEVDKLLKDYQHDQITKKVNLLIASSLVQTKLANMFKPHIEKIKAFRPSHFELKELEFFLTYHQKLIDRKALETTDFQNIGDYILKLLNKSKT